VSWLTSSYRVTAEDEDSGLVVQDIDYKATGVPVIRPGFSSRHCSPRTLRPLGYRVVPGEWITVKAAG
jgi:hypothetical protein